VGASTSSFIRQTPRTRDGSSLDLANFFASTPCFNRFRSFFIIITIIIIIIIALHGVLYATIIALIAR